MKTIAIFGGSKGLGFALADYFCQENNTVYNFSRSCHSNAKVKNIECDVGSDDVNDVLNPLEVQFDLVIYCPSLWLNAEENNAQELLDFINIGAVGLKRVVDTLFKNNLMTNNSILINIGSIASQRYQTTPYPSYAFNKKLQDMLIERYQQQDIGIKITNLILGSISNELVAYDDIINAIHFIANCGNGVVVDTLVLKHMSD